MHAYSKEAGLKEALRVTKPGGFLVLCDLHCGNGALDPSRTRAHCCEHRLSHSHERPAAF